MTHLLRAGLAAALLTTTAPFAKADCALPDGSLRLLSNIHSAVEIVVGQIEGCGNPGLDVRANLTSQHAEIQGPALSVNPAEYNVVIIANSSLTALLNAGLVRPLDDLVAEYGQNLATNQLIKVDGEVMAIAFMANAQHLFYRQDILEEAGLEPPTTWEEALEAAKAIRDKGIMQYPLASTMIPDWSLAQEFVNMYLGFGGEFFAPGSAEPVVDEAKAVQALEMLKELSTYMDPDYLTFDTEALVPRWDAGEVAMMEVWGSQAPSFMPGTSAAPDIAAHTVLAAAPSVGGRGVPATTVWWDGFAVAQNVPDEEAATAFQAMMHGLSPEMAEAHPEAAVWLIEGYQPTPSATGVMASVQGGAPSYSMLPYMGLLHDAFGANMAAFMTGGKTAEQVVADALRDYRTSARQAGFL